MNVVVRFAPSPTGKLHVGNLRAALVNYLYAVKHEGEFILRIDDTDQERSKPEFVEAIHADLEWVGVQYDTMFYQSHRFDRYNKAIQHLKNKNLLYPCFETAEELDFMRKRQLSQGKPPIYNRQALKLSSAEIEELIEKGHKPHWRYKLHEGTTEWDDLIRGEVRFEGQFASDPVLIREDGVPLYTLPSVVDDMDYGITHIIRGEDHVTNTAVQLQLIKDLSDLSGVKNTHIIFGHFSLISDTEGQGFSKRLGSLSLESLRKEGVEPMVLSSMLAKLGTSDAVECRESLEQLATELDFSKYGRSSPKFSLEDLERLNIKYLHMLPFNKVKEKIQQVLPQASQAFWEIVGGNIQHLSELKQWWDICQGDIRTDVPEEDKEYIKTALERLPAEWDETTWAAWTHELKEATGRKGKQLFMPLRLALTGQPHGPEMKLFLPFIDREKAVNRLKKAGS